MNKVVTCDVCGAEYQIPPQPKANCSACNASLVGIAAQEAHPPPEETVASTSTCRCETPKPMVTGFCKLCGKRLSSLAAEPIEPVQAENCVRVWLCIDKLPRESVTLPAILGRGSRSISPGAQAHLQSKFSGVSEKHLRLQPLGTTMEAQDLDSTNGSYIQEPDETWRQLAASDPSPLPQSGVLRLGQQCMVQYEMELPGGTTK